MVPRKPIIGAIPYTSDNTEIALHFIYFEIAYIFHTFFDGIDRFSYALKALVYYAGNRIVGVPGQVFAPTRFPVTMLSRMMLMKLASILEAFLIAIRRSKKQKSWL